MKLQKLIHNYIPNVTFVKALQPKAGEPSHELTTECSDNTVTFTVWLCGSTNIPQPIVINTSILDMVHYDALELSVNIDREFNYSDDSSKEHLVLAATALQLMANRM